MCRDETWSTLPRSVIGLWRVHTLVTAAVASVLLWLAGWVWWPTDWVRTLAWAGAGVTWVSAVAEVTWLVPRRWASYRYRLDERGLRQCEGVLWSRSLTVPADQILFLDVREGPVQRAMGLCTLRIGTLGSTHDLGPLGSAEASALAGAHLRHDSDHASR